MNTPSVENLKIPTNINEYLAENEFWEDDSFEPFCLHIEETTYEGKEIISFQVDFEINEDYSFETGYDLENLIREHIYTKDKDLLQKIRSDSENSTCVLWVNNELDYRKLLVYAIKVVQNEPK